ncbi:hypothetical protein AAHA92_13497 [Salvia divinorum]|uniref:Uncharacterized protein n=1 Tax=Salvia divinorum TaxID=28513 RepID=A0ABD1H8G1_SALDI
MVLRGQLPVPSIESIPPLAYECKFGIWSYRRPHGMAASHVSEFDPFIVHMFAAGFESYRFMVLRLER